MVRIVERTCVRIASKLAPEPADLVHRMRVHGAIEVTAPERGDRYSSRCSGRRRSICTTTTMKSIATRITASSRRIDCHPTGGPLKGVATASVSPAPIDIDATANWCELSDTTPGAGFAIAGASAGVSDARLPATASARPPSTQEDAHRVGRRPDVVRDGIDECGVNGRATNTVAVVPGMVEAATSHACPLGATAVVASPTPR